MTIFIHDTTKIEAGNIKQLSNATTADLYIFSERGMIHFNIYGGEQAIRQFCANFDNPQWVYWSEITMSMSVHRVNRSEVEDWKPTRNGLESCSITLGENVQNITLFRQPKENL